MSLQPFNGKYIVPENVHPLIAGVLTVMHERHGDMLDLIDGLPPDALQWTPGLRMSSLAGLTRHIMDVWVSTVRVAAGDLPGWHGENGAFLDATDNTLTLIACISEGDAYCKHVLPTLPAARLFAHWPGDAARTIGMSLIEEGDHSAMHYGHMQITRHLYEQAHPEFASRYVHWQ